MSQMSRKNVALFFVFDRLLTVKSETYDEELREFAPQEVLAVGIFGGYFDINVLSEHDRQTMEDFFKRLGKRYDVLDSRNKDEVLRFGNQLRERLS
jgi:hypothetical protein